MKEMIYGGRSRILMFATYKDRDFVIVNLAGRFPCAYVRTDINYYNDDNVVDDSPAHCGFTFFNDLSHWKEYDPENYDKDFFERNFIGWDFGHACDYHPAFCDGGKKWTTEEVFENVKKVIDWINIKEKKMYGI